MEITKYLSVEEWINNTVLLSCREIVLIVNIGTMTEQELHRLTWTNIKTLITVCKVDPSYSCTLKRPHSKNFSLLCKQIFHFYWKIPMSMQLAILIHSIFFKVIYLFLVVLGLCCCVWTFSSWGKQGLLSIEVHGLLTVGASQAWSTGSGRAGFSSGSMQAQQLQLRGSRVLAQKLWHTGLVAPWHVKSSWTRVNHCTTREVFLTHSYIPLQLLSCLCCFIAEFFERVDYTRYLQILCLLFSSPF